MASLSPRVRDGEVRDVLYDLRNDPGERTNRVDDPGQEGRVKDLKGRMETWFFDYVVSDKDGRDYGVTGTGQLRPVGREWEDGRDPFAGR